MSRRNDLVDAIRGRGWSVADRAASRFVGWMGRGAARPGDALCLVPCRAVHTAFLRFAIDVVFVARDGTVLGRVDGLRPWRIAWMRGAHAVLEFPAGGAARAGLAVGSRLAGPASAFQKRLRPGGPPRGEGT